MPLYERFADKYYEAGFEPYKDFWKSSSFESAHRVKFDLFKQYGLIAAAGNRHLAEFMPPNYLRDKETIASWKMQLTSVDSRMKTLKEKISDTKKIIAGEKDIEVKPSGEEGVEIILALLGLKDTVSNVNIPNKGQIGNLPLGSIVETNALIQRNSIRPVYAGKLPLDILNIVQRHAINQESIVKAALTKDKKLAFNTFVNEPLVSISRSQAEKLFAEMLNNTNKYLKEWDLS
ncbi:Family 4 glycosyl hydrolase C-terminal domain-containing protein [Pelosinus propionicus DSM 13327]|uniref:Family 4 glycosyl hydrolase C-terminal domain-containing protein n=2 Tax=Pelosinus TaxID=365348 RepID=A0A1I4MFY6_9FIRM|nr:Family 4 glycosyl hydrolase C-terminal domain-containing protein [Pelosinus propionicus DSM 13327]